MDNHGKFVEDGNNCKECFFGKYKYVGSYSQNNHDITLAVKLGREVEEEKRRLPIEKARLEQELERVNEKIKQFDIKNREGEKE